MRNAARLGLVLGIVLGFAAASHAKDVCTRTQFGSWKFHKVKPMKKRGSSVALQGVYSEAGETAPFHGTAYVQQDGQVVFGIFAHGLVHTNENILRDVSMTFIGAATFAGAVGQVDYTGDGANDDEVTWEVVDCDTLELP